VDVLLLLLNTDDNTDTEDEELVPLVVPALVLPVPFLI